MTAARIASPQPMCVCVLSYGVPGAPRVFIVQDGELADRADAGCLSTRVRTRRRAAREDAVDVYQSTVLVHVRQAVHGDV